MKKRYVKILIFLSFTLLFSSIRVVAQNARQDNLITIESVVTDEKGNPVTGATIYGNEGAVVTKTDASGKFTISVPIQSDLLIEAEGYESAVFKSGEIKVLKTFSLKTSKFLFGQKDVINVAFRKTYKGDIANSVSVINPDEILKYDDIQTISDVLTGRIPGLLGSSNIRGRGAPLFIVDGLPRDINFINLSEVDQITVLKDINSSILYGTDAINGVVLVKTKRGQPYKKEINVSGYYGISTVAALPKYLSSSDFMTLNNEARVNDGLAPKYDDATIANFANGNSYRYPNVDYYSDQYLRTIKPFSRILTQLSGGNEVATYYANLGWDRTGSFINFGSPSGNENKFNVRGNVDLKINNWIKTSLDAVVVFDNTESPVTNYWNSASVLQPQLFTPLIPFELINTRDNTKLSTAANAILAARKNDVNGMYLLGGTSSYQTNPIADIYSGGIQDNIRRTFSFNNKIDFDLGGITQGLKFHTNVSFDLYTQYNQSINNTYSVYSPTWKTGVDSIVSLTQYGADTRPGTQNIGNQYFERRFGFYGMLDYDRTFGDNHISGALVGYGNRYKVQGDFQGIKNTNLSLQLGYSYKNKYLVDFSSAFVNSVKLPPGNRTAFSPSLGLAWMISSEDFMSSLKFIDYLKLRVTGGILNSDAGIGGFYYYDNSYINSGSYSWDEATYSNSGTIPGHGENLLLNFPKLEELNFGFEGLLFNRMIGLDANIFTSNYSNMLTRSQTLYPSFYSSYVPYTNYNKNKYNGAELGIAFNRSFGNLSLVIGANALYANSKVITSDEIWAYGYQYRKGRPVDALFGLVADGFFKDQADIASHAFQTFGVVKPGDIKYVDQNGDNIIDANDQVQIGRYQAPFSYGLNLKLSYKSFTLFAEGNGRLGANSYISGNYYWVDGNDKYSAYVLNRWTPATAATATFPRLSSIANTNDFQSSTFWLYKDNYFTIKRIQLTYYMPETVAKMFLMKNLSFYVAASNLPVFSKQREIKELNIGTEPYYRSFSLGVKTTF